MRAIPSPIEQTLFTGQAIGDYKSQVRLTVEPDWYLNETTDVGTAERKRAPIRWWQNAAADQVEIEIPNVSAYTDDQNLDQPASACEITIDNTKMDPNSSGQNAALGIPGYFNPHHGGTLESQARWGHTPNEWSGVLDVNCLIRTYAGYGGEDLSIPDAVAAGNLMLQGVWIVDDVTATSAGVLTLTARSVASLLIDQPLYAGLVPLGMYPLEFYRWVYDTAAVTAKSLTTREVVPGVAVAAGDKRCRFIDSSADRWYPQSSPGSAIASGGYTLHGHKGADCLDKNPNTFCLSVGNSSPEKTFCTDWWTFACGEVINEVFIHPWAGNYTCYISVRENGKWQGDDIVPYTFYEMNGPGNYAVDTGADIPYVKAVGIPFEKGISIKLPRAYDADEVRISFRNHHRSQWGPWYYRCGMREVRLRASTSFVYGSTTASVTTPPAFFAADPVRDGVGGAGYLTVSQFGQVDAFGDAFILARTGGDMPSNGQVTAAEWIAGVGYYILRRDGTLTCHGTEFYGSPRSEGLQQSGVNLWERMYVAMAMAPDGLGYWLLRRDGHIRAYGSATDHGETSVPDEEYMTSMCAYPGGDGFVTLRSDGLVEAFGDATNLGDFSEAAASGGDDYGRLWCTDIRYTETGNGYWILSSDGRVQAFGDATDHGQMATLTPTTDVYRQYRQILSSDDNGYLLLRGDGNVFEFGDAMNFGGPVPGSIATIRRDGNIKDWSDIIKWLALWSGFHLFDTKYEDGTPAVYGNIESTGAYPAEALPLDFFDKKNPVDPMKQIADAVGYIGPYTDEEGALHWHTPNLWNYGNFLPDGTYTSETPELDERWTLTAASVQTTKQYDRSEIIITTEDPTENLETTVTTRFVPPNQQRLRGMKRPAMWNNGLLKDPVEQQVMAELVALQMWLRSRTAQISGMYHPGIQINDQIRILDRATGTTQIYYVLSKRTTYEKETGRLMMDISAHWMGDRDEWAITLDSSNTDQSRFRLKEWTGEKLLRRGTDTTALEPPRFIAHTGTLEPPPGTDGSGPET